MPVRIANHSVTVVREGKRYEIEAGQGIELSKSEIAQFNELNPDAFRVPATNVINVVNAGVMTEGESVSAPEEAVEEAVADQKEADTTKSAKYTKASASKGKASAKDADAGEGEL